MTRPDSAEVELYLDDLRWTDVGLECLARQAVSQVLAHLELDPSKFSVSVLACNDERIAALNSDFRAKPGATNVLSWPSRDRGSVDPGTEPSLPDPANPMDAELGDIAISFDTVEREAIASGTSFEHHTLHLIAHATLHLLGFDHISKEDAELMEGLEIGILAELDVANPYEGNVV